MARTFEIVSAECKAAREALMAIWAAKREWENVNSNGLPAIRNPIWLDFQRRVSDAAEALNALKLEADRLDPACAAYIARKREELAALEERLPALRAEYAALDDALKLRKRGTIRRLTHELQQKSMQIVAAESMIENCKYYIAHPRAQTAEEMSR